MCDITTAHVCIYQVGKKVSSSCNIKLTFYLLNGALVSSTSLAAVI